MDSSCEIRENRDENVPVAYHTIIDGYFTKGSDTDPLDDVEWSNVEVPELGNGHAFVVEAPNTWSSRSIAMAARHYVAPEDGKSIKNMIRRVASTITKWGLEIKTLTESEAKIFERELTYILLHRRASFNSPVWYNVGLADRDQLVSACFINSVDDSMDSITSLLDLESRIFKAGAGAGCNLSRIRASCEPVGKNTVGAMASGPVSFDSTLDHNASTIKSGGRHRRAARISILDVDHPDIEKFSKVKADAEKLARQLADLGYSTDFSKEQCVQNIVPYQSTNISIRTSNEFMRAAETNQTWDLNYRKLSGVAKTISASKLLDDIAEGIWQCGDPGLIFSDTITHWSMVRDVEEIRGGNPCQPDFAPVVTPNGIRTFAEVDAGSTIWSGKRWTKIVQKVSTGTKPVYAYHTRAGVFYGTEQHRVLSYGKKVEAQDASAIDQAVGPTYSDLPLYDPRDIMDGLVFGDGMVHKASGNLVLLCVGENDQTLLTSELEPLFLEKRTGIREYAWFVATTIENHEIPKTYNREVPDRFFHGGANKVCGFLRGLYSANGSIVRKRITLKAASFSVIESVQTMLSSIGIRSYYTINRSHDVEFENGTYECRQSYDLNVTIDRCLFKKLIGFVQPDKQQRLNEACETDSHAGKQTYEITDIEYLGDLPVFDITVDDKDHTYWTGGLLVSNCGEFLFVDQSACNLASINLVIDDDAITLEDIEQTTRVLATAQDILCSRADYPHPKTKENSHRYRPIGIGWTNLGGALLASGLPYDSQLGRTYAASITSWLTACAYDQSLRLAKRCGSFPAAPQCSKAIRDVFRQHETYARDFPSSDLWKSLVSRIEQGELPRNALVTLMAPTGSVGLLMDVDTTGIEPYFALAAKKQTVYGTEMAITMRLIGKGLTALGYSEPERDTIVNYVAKHGHLEGVIDPRYAPVFDVAMPTGPSGRHISPTGHLLMLSAIQPHISSGISKTINLPAATTADEIRKLVIEAWKLGVKSVTFYRDGSKVAQPLTTGKDQVKGVKPTKWGERWRLPELRRGFTHKFEIDGAEFYMHVGQHEDGSLGEVFFTPPKQGSTIDGLLDAWATAVSCALQSGMPLETFIEKFRGTKFSPCGWVKGESYTSLADYVFRFLEQHFISGEEKVAEEQRNNSNRTGDLCPRCGGMLEMIGNKCHKCRDCGEGSGGCS